MVKAVLFYLCHIFNALMVIYTKSKLKGGTLVKENPDLIRCAQAGEANSFESLVRMYQQRIFSFCYYMLGNKQEAEDAVQEVFLKAYRKLKNYRYDYSFSAWLYKIASNHCRTELKRKKKWKLLLPFFSIGLPRKNRGPVLLGNSR